MRENHQPPLCPLVAGFTLISGEEKPADPEEFKPKEKPELNEPTKKNKPSTKVDNTKSKCKQSKVVRRGGDCKKRYVKGESASCIKVFSANCAYLKHGKIKSLNAEVRSTKANIVTLQETHYRQKGKSMMDKSFVVFEAIRNKKGDGTVIAVHENLKPKLIEEYSDEFKLLVLEVKTESHNIRVISGYGPQENQNRLVKKNKWKCCS